MKTRTRLAALAAATALSATLVPLGTAVAADPYPGSQYREEYFEMGDTLGTRLHADVLRDEDASWAEKQPVILVVSPYTNHNGSTTDTNLQGGNGPMDRFYDFLDLSNALDQNYTFVQVDLPGNGGSSGCNDWGGEREQGAVKAAVEWAHRQPWSNGKVALLGKSYDGWTGLMGMAQDPIGLEAVVSMEPVFSGYRYLYNNGVRFLNSVTTNALFQVVDAKPGALNDEPEYHLNGAPQAWCYGLNMGLQQQDSEDVEFWAVRDLVRQAEGSDVPLFLTQGWLETNTKPDAALDYWNAMDHTSGDNRYWLGQFNHVRGWDRTGAYDDFETDSHVGREDFIEQVMAFLDEHLKGIEGADDHLPAIEVQDNKGRYRAEAQYPPADVATTISSLNTGSYTDSTLNSAGEIISVSDPLPYDAWLAGEPVVSATVTTTLPRGNFTVKTYEVDREFGLTTLINRGTMLIRRTGEQQIDLKLYGQDWQLDEGDRIMVVVEATDGFWVHVPTGQEITVSDVDIAFPFLTEERTDFVVGTEGVTPELTKHLGRQGPSVPAGEGFGFDLQLPGPMEPAEVEEDDEDEQDEDDE